MTAEMHLPKDNTLTSSKFGASSLRRASPKYHTKVPRLEIRNSKFKTMYLVYKTQWWCSFDVGCGSLNTGVRTAKMQWEKKCLEPTRGKGSWMKLRLRAQYSSGVWGCRVLQRQGCSFPHTHSHNVTEILRNSMKNRHACLCSVLILSFDLTWQYSIPFDWVGNLNGRF